MTHSDVDAANSAFWEELCGSGLAQSLGITTHDERSLARFDEAYLKIYPYLEGYVPESLTRNRDVLEIGLGYGTLASLIADRGARYVGLDVASGPVRMVHQRQAYAPDTSQLALQGSILDAPFASESFDIVVSIGCLHHTGSLVRSIEEVYRLLRPGGYAIVMLYNLYSLRRLVFLPRELRRWIMSTDRTLAALHARVRGWYDVNSAGDAAPHTDFVSVLQARQLLSRFSSVEVDVRNIDRIRLGPYTVFSRDALLGNLARLVGLDLYITAHK